MTELKRWLDDAPSDDIHALLAAAREENAPPRLLRRTLVALGTTSATVAAGASGASAASGAAKLGMLGIVLKWGGAGLVCGTLVAGAVAGVSRVATTHDTSRSRAFERPASPQTNPTPELPRTNPARTAHTATAPDAAPAPPSGPSQPDVAALPRTSAPAMPLPPATPSTAAVTLRSASSVRVPPPADPGPATAREVALVDAARTALRRGDGNTASSLLRDYEQRFVPAHLEPEVLYLRMQAAKTQGDREAARNAAARIVSQFPQSPEVGRAEELLNADSSADKK
ncbi:MAG TPA: hypothetical protein VLJ38_14530 [Polyangiaceae bacterium]|nr:hypothetical protein [Polyangiaceae bacterium]